mmetsp:Transcript_12390/g.18695  ORF Transcript_12390/g.18695 Transcript_12390/m.18695 type:complete len:203 (+) Transcript_12390:125-733(+)|eukprot:CAMPEP_0202726276 /NCGR_PEP_ID=MMETSP1385-20130828/184529_1 /ASSEMBLY_ACC=CAM_ASM_000861 /TAXON_ID=933848 /ORGANISM="Elphidium margaritaceum" /LENGTH=202 /DNA_ID=CAMNT_0049392493 /DNA_START=125 /DNA_END=733 /DNA_ORIENTATION=+
MTTNAIKIAKGDKDKKHPKVSQSIPANFYKNYIPPKTPSIRPQAPPSIPDFDALPKISPTGKGINLSKTGGFSLSSSRHPMSLPTGNRLMDSSKTPFDIKAYKQNHPSIAEEDVGSEQKEASSLEQRKAGLKVGSFTCFDVMTWPVENGPVRQLPEIQDNKDAASATSASTFDDDKGNKPPSDEEDEEPEDNDEDGVFDIEL